MEQNVFNSIAYAVVMVSNICNLRCKGCVTFTPYQKHPRNYPLDELKADIDRYFEIFHDARYDHFDLIGGEPLLHPHLPELVVYITEKHKNQIGELRILTNGTIKISDDLLKVCKNTEMQFLIDDYGDDLSVNVNYNKSLLDNAGVQYRWSEYKGTETRGDGWNGIGWIDFGDLSYKNYTIEQLEQLRLSCDELLSLDIQNKGNMRPHLHIMDGKVCVCDIQLFQAKHISLDEREYINLRDNRSVVEIRSEIKEFKQKTIEHCKYCNGFILSESKRNRIPAAIQLTDDELAAARQLTL
jgi:organic radical activating enzyme